MSDSSNLTFCRIRLNLRVAHDDAQRQPTGRFRDRIELADDERSAAVGLDDLNLRSPGQMA